MKCHLFLKISVIDKEPVTDKNYFFCIFLNSRPTTTTIIDDIAGHIIIR